MPRPGPRPYECVRRAWHSDRHQPIRGSIIREIFRVVTDAHSNTTKKNKEWQEKLPVVVLKAEEIMYSKANSEAEYTNLETLWDRVNDAINTIIRREESTETGDLLPPCVEAALNLGCVPVRASRSQRHCNPRSYLTPRTQEPSPPASRVLDRTTDERRPQLLPLPSGSQLNFARTPIANSAQFLSESNIHVNQNDNHIAPRSHSFPHENILTGHNQVTTRNTNTSLNSASVYPLYYGTHYQTEEYRSGPQFPENLHSKTIYFGKPVIASTAEPTKQNCFSYTSTENVINVIPQVDVMDTWENQRHEAECDLSLRLGTVSNQFGRTEKSLAPEMEDRGSSSSQEGGQLNEMRPMISNEFYFFPRKLTCDPDSSSRMWSSGGEGQNLEAAIRKGKEPFSSKEEGGQFCWQPDAPSDWFSSRITRPGS